MSPKNTYTTWTRQARRLALFGIALLLAAVAQAQQVAVKTNALYWATLGSANLEAEVAVGKRSSLNLMLGYNPWTFSNNKKLKHLSVMPGYRYWLCQPFSGHFFSAQAEYAHFNAGGVNFPFGIWKALETERLQGDMVAAGVGYGYHHILSPRWSLEAEIGLGLGYAWFDRYECATCGSKLGSDKKAFLKPTRAALSIVYIIK